jgi:CRISPR system Cascade subunit CasA
MDNMKARCWYEHSLPLIHISKDQQALFYDSACRLLEIAKRASLLLRGVVKASWFSRPKDVKGDMDIIIQAFWQETEDIFYRQLYSLTLVPEGERQMPREVATDWHKTIKNTALKLFDEYTLAADPEDINMCMVVPARTDLSVSLHCSKPFKAFLQIAKAEKEVSQ